jgi:hypothetical protein
MWCVPKLDQEYVQRMEQVLDILSQPAESTSASGRPRRRPVQLLDSVRPGEPMAPGKVALRDYEYQRCGIANVFCIVEPKGGRHHTHATPNRKGTYFAKIGQDHSPIDG